MIVHHDNVLDINANTIFSGLTEETVRWLEKHPSIGPRWVHLTRNNDVITESQYLDLYGN